MPQPQLTRYGSPYNWQPEIVRKAKKPKRVEIHDLTLEGDAEEMAGVRFTHRQRVEIAKALSEAGVPRISVLGNSPRPTRGEVKSAETIAGLGLKARVGALVKSAEEIDTCRRIGLKGVTILVGVNDAVLTGGRTGKDIIDRCKALTEHARGNGLHTCLMGMDATRTRPEFLKQVVKTLDPYFDEFVVSDSLGVVSPFGMHHLVSLVSQWTRKPLQIHPHNHTSACTANAVAAVLAGATIIHATVNGVGEFTGLAPLEEFAVAVEMHAGATTGIDLSRLQELSRMVAEATGTILPPYKPVTGRSAFAVPETEEIQQVYYELHREQRFNDGMMYPPEIVGAESIMAIGRKCHAYTVLYHLEINGYEADFETASKIAQAVRAHLKTRKGYVLIGSDELMAIAKKTGFRLKRSKHA